MSKYKGHTLERHSTERYKKNNSMNKEKHSLDSDEEDYIDESECLDMDTIEGEEDCSVKILENEHLTAFNLQEELEEGYFDKSGYFIWNDNKDMSDNWLDSIDFFKIESNKYSLADSERVLTDDSDSEIIKNTNEIEIYNDILSLMKPGESISEAIKRLDHGNKKLSTIEKLKMKKAGTLKPTVEVTQLTELANKILTEKGNMNIYEETYETIHDKIEKTNQKEIKLQSKIELDMYADDFEMKEKQRISAKSAMPSTPITNLLAEETSSNF